MEQRPRRRGPVAGMLAAAAAVLALALLWPAFDSRSDAGRRLAGAVAEEIATRSR